MTAACQKAQKAKKSKQVFDSCPTKQIILQNIGLFVHYKNKVEARTEE